MNFGAGSRSSSEKPIKESAPLCLPSYNKNVGASGQKKLNCLHHLPSQEGSHTVYNQGRVDWSRLILHNSKRACAALMLVTCC